MLDEALEFLGAESITVRLLKEGTLFCDGRNVLGKASDGTVVSAGYVMPPTPGVKRSTAIKPTREAWQGIERYLQAHPTPEQW